jgi:hypothetical protein
MKARKKTHIQVLKEEMNDNIKAAGAVFFSLKGSVVRKKAILFFPLSLNEAFR